MAGNEAGSPADTLAAARAASESGCCPWAAASVVFRHRLLSGRTEPPGALRKWAGLRAAHWSAGDDPASGREAEGAPVFSCPSGFSRLRNNTNKSNGTGTGNTRTTGTATDNMTGFSLWREKYCVRDPAHPPQAGGCRFPQAERLPGSFRGLTVRNTANRETVRRANPPGHSSAGIKHMAVAEKAV